MSFHTSDSLFYLISVATAKQYQDTYCFHSFLSSQQNGTNVIRFICRNCFLHTTISRTSGKDEHHLFKTNITITKDVKHIEAICDCTEQVDVFIKNEVFPKSLLNDILSNKEPADQIYALLMLIFYVGNIVHGKIELIQGELKPINSMNPKFKQYIGANEKQ